MQRVIAGLAAGSVALASSAGAMVTPAGADDGPFITMSPEQPRTPRPYGPDSPETVDNTPTTQATTSAAAASSCPAAWGCFWVDPNYKNASGKVQGNNPTWGAFSQADCPSGTWKNCASSAANNRPADIFALCTDVNYGGDLLGLYPGVGGNLGSAFNDNIESNLWL